MNEPLDVTKLMQQVILAALKPQLDGMYQQIADIKLNPAGFQNMDIATIFGNTKFVDTLRLYIDQQINEMLKLRGVGSEPNEETTKAVTNSMMFHEEVSRRVDECLDRKIEELSSKITNSESFNRDLTEVVKDAISNEDFTDQIEQAIKDNSDLESKIDSAVTEAMENEDFVTIIREALNNCEVSLRIR